MKSYEDMAKSVLERRDAYRAEQKARRKALLKAGSTALVLALFAGTVFFSQRAKNGSNTAMMQEAAVSYENAYQAASSDMQKQEDGPNGDITANGTPGEKADAMHPDSPVMRDENSQTAANSVRSENSMAEAVSPAAHTGAVTSGEDMPPEEKMRDLAATLYDAKLTGYGTVEEMSSSVTVFDESKTVSGLMVQKAKIGNDLAIVFQMSGKWYSLSGEGASSEELVGILDKLLSAVNGN